MSKLALFIAIAVLVPVLTGVIAGVAKDPWGRWRDTLNVAAIGSAVIAGVLFVVILVAMGAHPTECVHGHCHETDTQASVQGVFVVVLLPPIYALVLPGAALGKLLGRKVRRRVELEQRPDSYT